MGKSKKRKLNEIEKCWNECFSQEYVIPAICENSEFMTNVEIEQLLSDLASEKEKLNATKSLLNSFDIVQWRKHTTKMHKCGFVVSQLKYRVKAEFVTQAWAKFYTILSTFQLIPNLFEEVCSFHLCEAPGAFVASLNHYLNNHSGGNFQGYHWTATTLNPYYEGNDLGHMIPDDRFIIETLPHWDFGNDFTGNIMCIDNLEHFKMKFKDTHVHLVTADGSIDCSEDPGEQENTVSLLFLWEVVTALSVLSNTGSFVIKIFTIFEKFTISMLFFLKNVFEEVNLHKPGPSKPGNSEVYVVCQGFLKEKCSNSVLFEVLLNAAINMDTTLAVTNFSNIPKTFLMALKDYVRKSCSKQKQIIEVNVENYGKMTPEDDEQLKYLKNCIAKKFIEKFEIYEINDYVSPILMWKTKQKLPNAPHIIWQKTGSYNDRQQSQTNTSNFATSTENKTETVVDWYHADQDQFDFGILKSADLIIGKKFLTIHSSSFCDPILFDEYSKIKHSTKVNQCDFLVHLEHLQEKFDNISFMDVNRVILLGDDSVKMRFEAHFTDQHTKTSNSLYSNDENKLVAICSIFILSDEKLKSIDLILQLLSLLESQPCNAIIKIDCLVLSNFWNGVLFLISQLYEKSSFYKPYKNEQSIYMVCMGFKSNEKNLKRFTLHISEMKVAFSALSPEQDIIHFVPIYSLLQSNFRAFVTSCNGVFVRELSSSQ